MFGEIFLDWGKRGVVSKEKSGIQHLGGTLGGWIDGLLERHRVEGHLVTCVGGLIVRFYSLDTLLPEYSYFGQ